MSLNGIKVSASHLIGMLMGSDLVVGLDQLRGTLGQELYSAINPLADKFGRAIESICDNGSYRRVEQSHGIVVLITPDFAGAGSYDLPSLMEGGLFDTDPAEIHDVWASVFYCLKNDEPIRAGLMGLAAMSKNAAELWMRQITAAKIAGMNFPVLVLMGSELQIDGQEMVGGAMLTVSFPLMLVNNYIRQDLTDKATQAQQHHENRRSQMN